MPLLLVVFVMTLVCAKRLHRRLKRDNYCLQHFAILYRSVCCVFFFALVC